MRHHMIPTFRVLHCSFSERHSYQLRTEQAHSRQSQHLSCTLVHSCETANRIESNRIRSTRVGGTSTKTRVCRPSLLSFPHTHDSHFTASLLSHPVRFASHRRVPIADMCEPTRDETRLRATAGNGFECTIYSSSTVLLLHCALQHFHINIARLSLELGQCADEALRRTSKARRGFRFRLLPPTSCPASSQRARN